MASYQYVYTMSHLTKTFPGGREVLKDVTLAFLPGAKIGVLGVNGAGKSTAMKAIIGLVKVREGHIRFNGQEITGRRPDEVAKLRVCYVPQEKNVFPTLTVHENLEMGAFLRDDDYSGQLDAVYEIFPALVEKRRQPAGSLSGGQRQMVAMGRALMLEPKLLLLDEPTAGLSPLFTDMVFDKVKEINATGVAILMVEQNAKDALALADRGYVLALGRNRHEDTGANLLANREVAEMFLGG